MKREIAYKVTTHDCRSLYHYFLSEIGKSIKYSTKRSTNKAVKVFVVDTLKEAAGIILRDAIIWKCEGVFFPDQDKIYEELPNIKLSIDPRSKFMHSVRLVEKIKF